MKRIKNTGILLLLLLSMQQTAVAATLQQGARLYIDRCALCHGNMGMGDSLMVSLQESYPSTNLLAPRFGADKPATIAAIRWGGAQGAMNALSPPWNFELSDQEIEAVGDFVIHLREDTEAAQVLLHENAKYRKPNVQEGRYIFQSRCTVCHGRNADGKGRLAGRVINDPPPFNLRASTASADMLREVILKGGATVGRSPQMPPWQGEMLPSEVDSVVLYLLSLRAGKEQVK